jgi:sensor histidine kinase YesM
VTCAGQEEISAEIKSDIWDKMGNYISVIQDKISAMEMKINAGQSEYEEKIMETLDKQFKLLNATWRPHSVI